MTKNTDLLEKNDATQKSTYNPRLECSDNRVYYGDSSEVNPLGYRDYNDYIKSLKKTQSMNGFDPEYKDFVHYIIGITHKIWEEKSIGYIYKVYHNDVTMHLGSSNVTGINTVIAGTLQTLHAFPDRKLFGENVVWSGNERDGFYSSHKIQSVSTNLGDSAFGSATGKRIVFRTTVDCFVHSNRIVEEWLVRDNLYIVQQLGLDPHEVAKKMALNEGQQKGFQTHFGLGETINGQLSPSLHRREFNNFEIGDFVLDVYNKLWELREFDQVRMLYSHNASVTFICDKDLIGYQQIQGMLISLFSSFPNARFIVDRVTINERELPNSWDVSVRWRLQGIHEGIGYFGQPSGAPIEILGINQLRVENGLVTREWITFDGLDVLKQIYAYKAYMAVEQPSEPLE